MCFVRISEQTSTFALTLADWMKWWRTFTARYGMGPYTGWSKILCAPDDCTV